MATWNFKLCCFVLFDGFLLRIQMKTAYSIDWLKKQTIFLRNNSDRVLILDNRDLLHIYLNLLVKCASERNKASLKAILVHLSIFRFVDSTGLVWWQLRFFVIRFSLARRHKELLIPNRYKLKRIWKHLMDSIFLLYPLLTSVCF